MLESEYFVKQIGINGITKQSIIKFFSHIRNLLRKNMHLKWSKSLMGEDGTLDEKRYISCEIDESEIIGSNNFIYWMFGIIKRENKEARVFYVLNNGTKENLLPIFKNNIETDENEENEEELHEEVSVKTRIFSDCF